MVVVANGPWPKHVSPTRVSELAVDKVSPGNDRMTAKAVLICRPNSHPFQDRTLLLEQSVKIGRSVARARPAANNAIFDCKVLSRNHALLWYDNGKFYLQDTKSSNGTFVNNQRLSKGSEESPPREVCSADIVQFGVDVMENARKVTHGCIVATLKLYLPDGKEAKASPSTSVVSMIGMVAMEDLYQLNQYLQEALSREQLLENKLATLQRLVGNMRQASDEGWKALIDEDRLLSRVEILENQLQTCSKTFGEDKIREELRKLQDDKEQYQGAAKETLRKVLHEKLEAIQKLQDVERALSNSEDECNLLRDLCEKNQLQCKELAQKYKITQVKLEEAALKLQQNEESQTEMFDRLEQEKLDLQRRLEEQLQGERNLQVRLEALQVDDDITSRQLNAVEVHLRDLQTNNSHSKNNEMKKDPDNQEEFIMEKLDEEMSENIKEAQQSRQEEVESLKHRLEVCEDEHKCALARLEILQQQLEESKLEYEQRKNSVYHLQEEIQTISSNRDAESIETKKDINDETIKVTDSQKDKSDKIERVTKYQDELVKLEELLEEARTGKQAAEEQVVQIQAELKSTNSICDKSMEEINLLRQQLQQVAFETGNKFPMLQLEQQMVNLVSSSQSMQAQMLDLQLKLQEEHQLNRQYIEEIENLKKQVIESQQSAKQCKNEAEKMKDIASNLQKDMEAKRIFFGSLDDNKKREQLSKSLQECESLQNWITVMENEMKTLKSEHSKLEEENKTLKDIKTKYEDLTKENEIVTAETRAETVDNLESKHFSELTHSPSSNAHDLIQLKQLYAACQQRKAELAKDLEDMKAEATRLSNQSNITIICGSIPMIILVWALITHIYSLLSIITATSD